MAEYIVKNGETLIDTDLIHDSMFILSGGSAYSTDFREQGSMYISKGGVATKNYVSSGGFLSVLNGGKAEITSVNHGFMSISKGGVAEKTSLCKEGSMNVLNGGKANTVWLTESALLTVTKGGLADKITLNRAYVVIEKGGSASNLNVGDSGYGATVTLNGSLDGATVYYSAKVDVNKGGAASNVTINQGLLTVSTGGKAYNTNMEAGLMEVSGGTVNDTTVTSGYFVLSGGTINKLSIEKGSGCVSSGGGTINDLTLSGGFISFYSGTINRATVDHGDIYCYSGGKLNSATFNGGYLIVSSNCTANKITLENSAHMDVYQSKSKASGITVRTGGSMYIGSGADVSNLTLLGGDADPAKDKYAGRLAAHGGTIKGLTIGSGTSVGLFQGCTATKVKWTPGDGTVNIWSASVSFTSKYSGVYVGLNGSHVSSGTQAKELVSETLKLGGSAYVAKGGVASGLEIASGGSVYVWNGGKALQTQVGIGESNSYLNVSSGGTASDVTIFEKGGLNIYSGGKASTVTICNGGAMSIEGGSADGIEVETGGALGIFGGTATNVKWTPFEGELQVWGNAQITFAGDAAGVYIGTNGVLDKKTDQVEGRTIGDVDMGIKYSVKEEMYVMSDGKAKSIIVGNNGSMYVFDGGSAGNTTICGGGQVYVYNGGSASIVEVNGGEFAVFGGTATDVTLSDYGIIYVTGGSADNVTVGAGASGYIDEGGSLNGATLCSGVYRSGGALYVSSGAVVSNLVLEYGASLYIEKGAKVTNVSSSYGSYINAEKGATVKKITAVVAESPDSDHDEKNGWEKKKKTINPYVMNDPNVTVINNSTDSIKFDENDMTYDSYDNYVGYKDDEIDFKKVHLDTSAKLSFDVFATDAGKFTIWRWDDKKKKLISLQATALKLVEENYIKSAKSPSSYKYYYAGTKELILGSGDYYLSMESTNAAKGSNTYYNVLLSDESVFFPLGDNKDDKWDTLSADYDRGELTEKTSGIEDEWVGFGDAIDYRKFTVAKGMKAQFDLSATDATKFTLYQLVTKTSGKKTTSSLKKLQSVTLKQTDKDVDCFFGLTEMYDFEAGTEYYLSMESTNAAKGGNASYSIEMLHPENDDELGGGGLIDFEELGGLGGLGGGGLGGGGLSESDLNGNGGFIIA